MHSKFRNESLKELLILKVNGPPLKPIVKYFTHFILLLFDSLEMLIWNLLTSKTINQIYCEGLNQKLFKTKKCSNFDEKEKL